MYFEIKNFMNLGKRINNFDRYNFHTSNFETEYYPWFSYHVTGTMPVLSELNFNVTQRLFFSVKITERMMSRVKTKIDNDLYH